MENKKTTKQNFNYDLSNLPTYNSYGDEMMIKAFLGLTLPKYSAVKPNLKGTTEKVGFVTDTIYLQDISCGWDPSGTTTQNVVTIDLCNKKLNQQLCPYSLYDTYLSQYLSDSNFQESVPFEEVINSQCFNGVKTLITSGNGATAVAYTAATPTNGLDVFTTYYQNIPENVLHRDDLVIYCGFADYRALIASMRNSSYVNLFSFDDKSAASGNDWSVMLPGTSVRVIPTQGLTGQNYVCAGAAGYILVGMNNEMMTIRSMYDPFVDEIKINLHATYGVGVFDVASFMATA